MSMLYAYSSVFAKRTPDRKPFARTGSRSDRTSVSSFEQGHKPPDIIIVKRYADLVHIIFHKKP